MILLLCRSMLGTAQKEKRPLSLGNVVEQMRTPTCKRTRGFRADAVDGTVRGCCAQLYTVCTVWRHLGRMAGGTDINIQALPLARPCHAEERASYKGTFLPLGMHPLPGSSCPECPSHMCVKAPAGSLAWGLSLLARNGGPRGEGLPGGRWDSAHQEWGTRGIGAESPGRTLKPELTQQTAETYRKVLSFSTSTSQSSQQPQDRSILPMSETRKQFGKAQLLDKELGK